MMLFLFFLLVSSQPCCLVQAYIPSVRLPMPMSNPSIKPTSLFVRLKNSRHPYRSRSQHRKLCGPPSFRLDLAMNPNDLESEEEREERMKLVRQMQKSFYQQQPERDSPKPQSKAQPGSDGVIPSMFEEENRNDNDDDDDPTVLQDIPLWRVQWTELPGYQNVLNVHVAHYTHMFHTVFAQPKPWYFGHVYLPGGSENMENPLYRLPDLDNSSSSSSLSDAVSLSSSKQDNEATLVGTLMQVSDYKLLDDGRLALIVQSLERIQIVGVTQHIPYAIATIKRIPDSEQGSMEDGTSDNDEWREFEFHPTLWDDLIIPSTPSAKKTASSQGNFISVSPLVNYDGSHFPNELDLSTSSNTGSGNNARGSDSSMNDVEEDAHQEDSLESILKMERNVWISLDTMLRLLTTINPQLQIPVPSQLLGLLPFEKDLGNASVSDKSIKSWPIGFKLEEYATQLQSNNAIIGTTSKSPFIRVSENISYPITRRASRLSYTIWIILESISTLQGSSAGSSGPPFPTKQQILEETSITKRLQMGYEQLEIVNTLLRQTLQ